MTAKILLVEDDQNFGDVLKSYLEMNDYDVNLATDGELGLAEFKKQDYDLCILDVMMPKKDGFTLAKEIREKDKDTPIIALTAISLDDSLEALYAAGCYDVVTQPFKPEVFYQKIGENILEHKVNKPAS